MLGIDQFQCLAVDGLDYLGKAGMAGYIGQINGFTFIRFHDPAEKVVPGGFGGVRSSW